MKLLWLIFYCLSFGYLCLAVFALVAANKMTFPVPNVSYTKNSFPLVELSLSSGSKAYATYLPNENAKYTLLYCHGNAEDLGTIYPHLTNLQRCGFAVLAFDYPGYGLSPGKPSERGCFDAAEAAFKYLTENLRIKNESIMLYGRSLGSGSALHIASREPVAGVILNGAFTSTFRTITRYKILPWDNFDNLALIDQITCPVLFIHGKQDVTVPFYHSEQLYNRIQGEKFKLWVESAGHNDLMEHAHDDYWKALQDFVD